MRLAFYSRRLTVSEARGHVRTHTMQAPLQSALAPRCHWLNAVPVCIDAHRGLPRMIVDLQVKPNTQGEHVPARSRACTPHLIDPSRAASGQPRRGGPSAATWWGPRRGVAGELILNDGQLHPYYLMTFRNVACR